MNMPINLPEKSRLTDIQRISPKAAAVRLCIDKYLHLTNVPNDFNTEEYFEGELGLGGARLQPGEGNPRKTHVKVEEKFDELSDSRSAGAIPDHNDGSHDPRQVSYLAFQCLSPGDNPTPTILNDFGNFANDHLPVEVFNDLVEREQTFRNDFSHLSVSSPIITALDGDYRLRYSQNSLLLGSSSPSHSDKEKAFEISTADDFIKCLVALYQAWADRPENQIHLLMGQNDLAVISNSKLTHRVNAGKDPGRHLVRWFF